MASCCNGRCLVVLCLSSPWALICSPVCPRRLTLLTRPPSFLCLLASVVWLMGGSSKRGRLEGERNEGIASLLLLALAPCLWLWASMIRDWLDSSSPWALLYPPWFLQPLGMKSILKFILLGHPLLFPQLCLEVMSLQKAFVCAPFLLPAKALADPVVFLHLPPCSPL